MSAKFEYQISSIPKPIKQIMVGTTWHKGCPAQLDDLAYLKLSYWGFDHKPHIGELIINKVLAQETVDIFRKIYQEKFPIHKMILPSRLRKANKSETQSDDTHGFRCDPDGDKPGLFSTHAYGVAIDINPVENPAKIDPKLVKGGISPQNGKPFLKRSPMRQGMVNAKDPAFNAFTKHGWEWGGFYPKSEIDYMHFRKIITQHYRVNKMYYLKKSDRISGLPDF